MVDVVFPLLLITVGLALGVWSWPYVWERIVEARNKPLDAEAAALAEELFERNLHGADGPQILDECRYLDRGDDPSALASLRAFIAVIDDGLAEDDPAVWPDEELGAARLVEAAALMDSAEQIAERLAGRTDGGAAAAGPLDEAVNLLVEAKEHWTSGAACRAALARAVWIRARARDHRYRKAGLVATLRLANDALQRDPRLREAEIMRARAQVGLGKLDAARHALIDLMGRHPHDPDIIRTRSRWLWSHGDVLGATNAIVDILAKTPEAIANAERLRVGPGLLKQGRWREAAEVYEALLRWDEGLAEGWSGKARCLAERGKYAEAAEAAKKSLELDPTAEAREVLKRAMVRAGGGDA